MILISDHWQGISDNRREERFPDWESVERAIGQLDETVQTLVVLDDERGSNLFVGGGPSGIVVALSMGDEHLIARQGDKTQTTLITAGGQEGDYRKRNVISLEHSKDIAKAFFNGIDVRSLGRWEHG